ncbi:MAG: hypothetical protein RLZ98_3009 [Pseudomonadota bacterium]|jgi:drug/metabolite transporter (DMT)-like permease
MSIGETLERWPPVVQCAFWIIVAGVLGVAQLAAVRHIAPDTHIFVIVFFRSVFGLMFLSPLMVSHGGMHFRSGHKNLLVLCGVIAFIATACLYFAAKHMPLADITAIHFTRPIFASIVAAVVLREVLSGNRILALVFGVIGAAIIIRPGLVSVNIGVLYVAGVIAAQSFNPIVRKTLSKAKVHPDTVAIWVALAGLPLATIAATFVWVTPTWYVLGWMVFIALCETLNQRVLGRAYGTGDAIVVVGLHYTRLPIAALVGLLAFGDVPEIWIWLGAAVIAIGAVILVKGEMNNGKSGVSL